MASKLSRGQKIAIAVFVSLVVIGLFSALVWGHFSDDENTCVGFDCTNSPNSLNANPAGITCQADPCTAQECCTSSTGGDDCTTPDPVPPGYNLTNVTGSPSKSNFTITGVECATGYTGTATATACSVAGQPYTLSGCSASTTGSTAGSGTNCDANEPTLTGSNMNAITADSCDGTAIGGTCGHTCDGGHTGGSVTCQADGTWAVVPCNPADVVTEDDFSNVTFTLSGHQESCTEHCGDDLGKQCMNENYASEFADVGTYTEGGIYPSECTSFRSSSPSSGIEPFIFGFPGEHGECRYASDQTSRSYCDYTNHTGRRICKCGTPP